MKDLKLLQSKEHSFASNLHDFLASELQTALLWFCGYNKESSKSSPCPSRELTAAATNAAALAQDISNGFVRRSRGYSEEGARQCCVAFEDKPCQRRRLWRTGVNGKALRQRRQAPRKLLESERLARERE